MSTVVVIGSGVVGLSCAWYAAEAGHKVLVLERGGPDRDCCSLGNAGLIVPSHLEPLAAPGAIALALRLLPDPESAFGLRPRLDPAFWRWCRLFAASATRAHVERSAPLLRDYHLAGRDCFIELANVAGNGFRLVRQGLLTLCRTEAGFAHEKELARLVRRHGLEAEVALPERLEQLNPGLQIDAVGGVYYPRDAHVDPERFMSWLTGALTARGVDLRWSTEVLGWRRVGQHVGAVVTRRGEIVGDHFVLAAGAWSARLARDLGLRLPLVAGKGHSLTIGRPRRMPSLACLLTEARIAVTPLGDSLRFAGTMELGGLETAVNPRRVAGMVKAIPRYFPNLTSEELRAAESWVGLRPCSPDGLPYVGRTRRYRNLLVACGHAMMGLSLGPITGRLIAALLTGEPAPFDLTLLDPDRFDRR